MALYVHQAPHFYASAFANHEIFRFWGFRRWSNADRNTYTYTIQAMPSRLNETQGKAPSRPRPGPSTIASRSTLRPTFLSEIPNLHDQAQPARASTGPLFTTYTTNPDSALVENLSRRIRSFLTSLFIANRTTYAEHLRPLQLSLETHLRNYYTSIKSDATWEHIFGWCPNRSAVEGLLHLQRPSYILPAATSFATSFDLPVTWLNLGVLPPTQRHGISSETAPVPWRASPTAPPRRPWRRPHMQTPALPPQTRPALHTRVSAAPTAITYTTSSTNGSGSRMAMGSQLPRPGEASSTIGATAARAPLGHRPPVSASARTNIVCRRQRPALRVDRSPSRINSNSSWVDDLLSDAYCSLSDEYDDDDEDEDDGEDVGIHHFVRRYRIRIPRYLRAQVDNTDQFPALPTAVPAAQLVTDPSLEIPGHTDAPAQPPQPDLLTATRKLAEETSILLERYSRSTSQNGHQNYETIRTALDSVHEIWDKLLRSGRANEASYSAAAMGLTSGHGGCIWGGRTALEAETFRPYSACIICYNAVADTVLMPCHHLVLCLVRSGRHHWRDLPHMLGAVCSRD